MTDYIGWMYIKSRKEHRVFNFWVSDGVTASEILFWIYLKYVPLV